MKVHELGIPRLEATMQNLLQRPSELEIADVKDLVDAALGCLKRGDLLLSNTVIVQISRGINTRITQTSIATLDSYAEILEEVFGG